MRLIVDEMPCYPDECPFVKREWENHNWIDYCSLTYCNCKCNLYEKINACHGLRKVTKEELDNETI